MKVRVKIIRIFDDNCNTLKYETVSSTNNMFLKYFFYRGGFETIAQWKIKLK